MVGSYEESKKAVESAYYPPIGRRSKGSPAAVFYGSDYYSKINDALNLIVMIETPEAAENADEILSVPGVTGCLIGAGDLSFVMKETNRSSEFESVVARVLATGKKRGVADGYQRQFAGGSAVLVDEGRGFLSGSHDMGILNSGIRSHEKKFVNLTVVERK